MKTDDLYLQVRLNNYPFTLLIFIFAIFIVEIIKPEENRLGELDLPLHIGALITIVLEVILIYQHHYYASKENVMKIVKLNQVSTIIELFYCIITSKRETSSSVIIHFVFCLFLYVLSYTDAVMKLLICMVISFILTWYSFEVSDNPLCFMVVMFSFMAHLQSFHLLFVKCNEELLLSEPITSVMNKMTQTLTNAMINALPSKLLPRVLENESLPCDIIPDVCYIYIHLKTDNSEIKNVDSENSKLYLSKVNEFYCILDYLSEICNIQKVKSSYSYFMACVGTEDYLVGGHLKLREKNYPTIFDEQKLLIFFALAAELTANLLDLKCASGITRGSIVLGVLGEGSDTLNFDTYGDTVNTAARIAINAEDGVHLAIKQFLGKSSMHRIDSKIEIERNEGYGDYFRDNDMYLPSLLFLLESEPCYFFKESSRKIYKGKGELKTVRVEPARAFINVLFTVLKKSNACALLESLNQQDQEQLKEIDLMNDLINTISLQDATDSLNIRITSTSEISSADIDLSELEIMLDPEYIFLDAENNIEYSSIEYQRNGRSHSYFTPQTHNESVEKELIDFEKMALQRRLDESDSDDEIENLNEQIEEKKLFSLSTELGRPHEDTKFYKDYEEIIPSTYHSYVMPHAETLGNNLTPSSDQAKKKLSVAEMLDDEIDLIEVDEGSQNTHSVEAMQISHQNLFTIFGSQEGTKQSTEMYKLHASEESESEVMDSKFFERSEKHKTETKHQPMAIEPEEDIDIHEYDEYFDFVLNPRTNYFTQMFKLVRLVSNLQKETMEEFKKSDTYLSINLKPLNHETYFLILTALIFNSFVLMLILFAHVKYNVEVVVFMFTFTPLELLITLNGIIIVLYGYEMLLRLELINFLNNLQRKTMKMNEKQKIQFYRGEAIQHEIILFLIEFLYIVQIIVVTDQHVRVLFDSYFSTVLFEGANVISYLLSIFENISFVAVPSFMITGNFESIIASEFLATFILIRRMPEQIVFFFAFCCVIYVAVIPLIALQFHGSVESIEEVISINKERFLLTGILPRITIDSLLATSSPEVLEMLMHSFPFLQKYRNRLFELYDVTYTLEHGKFATTEFLRNSEDTMSYTELEIFERMYYYLRIPNYQVLEPTRPVINFENAAYLNLDIANFTEFSSKLPVEEMMRFLNTLFKRFDERIAKAKNLMQVKISGDSYEIMSFPCVLKMYPTTLSEKEHFDNRIPLHIEKLFKTPEELRKSYDSIVVLIGTALGFIRDCEQTVERLAPEYQNLLHLRVGVSFGNVIGSLLGNRESRFDTFGTVPREAERIQSLAKLDTVAISERVFDILTYGQIEFKSFLLSKISQTEIVEGQEIMQENEVVEFNYVPFRGEFCIDALLTDEGTRPKLRKNQSVQDTRNNEKSK